MTPEGFYALSDTFPNVEAFYAAADPQARRFSGEADFGLYWYEAEQGWSPSWKVSAVENTGEIYVEKIRDTSRNPQTVGFVVVLGCLGPDAGYAKAEAVLEGWANVCGASSSLEWVIERVHTATHPKETRPTSLGELAGHVVLLLEALRPWDALAPELRTRCAEMTRLLARLPAGEEAGPHCPEPGQTCCVACGWNASFQPPEIVERGRCLSCGGALGSYPGPGPYGGAPARPPSFWEPEGGLS